MAVSIAMVALDRTAKISGKAICDAWLARWPRSARPRDLTKNESTFSFHVGEHLIAFGLMPAPIPGMTDADGPCAKTPFWPNAAAEMRSHSRHVIVTVAGDANPTDQMRVLTQATAALVDSCNECVGVYWPSSALLFPAKQFCDIACRFLPEGFPLPIWINFRIAKNADRASAGLTQGLSALGKMEFETTSSPESPKELRERLLGLVGYVLDGGPVIKNGDTIGEDANERIKVIYGPSSFGGEGRVMRLEYPTRKRYSNRLTTYGYLHALATLVCTVGFGCLLYAWFPFLRGSVFRHFILLPLTLVFGFLLLLISDQYFENKFGWQAFHERKS
jgi:uncharacterized protein DUF4261